VELQYAPAYRAKSYWEVCSRLAGFEPQIVTYPVNLNLGTSPILTNLVFDGRYDPLAGQAVGGGSQHLTERLNLIISSKFNASPKIRRQMTLVRCCFTRVGYVSKFRSIFQEAFSFLSGPARTHHERTYCDAFENRHATRIRS